MRQTLQSSWKEQRRQTWEQVAEVALVLMAPVAVWLETVNTLCRFFFQNIAVSSVSSTHHLHIDFFLRKKWIHFDLWNFQKHSHKHTNGKKNLRTCVLTCVISVAASVVTPQHDCFYLCLQLKEKSFSSNQTIRCLKAYSWSHWIAVPSYLSTASP